MKTVVVVLSVSMVALVGGMSRAQAAAATSSTQATPAKSGKPDDAALLAAPGVITPESLAEAARKAGDGTAGSKDLASQLSTSPEVLERVRVRFRKELPLQYPDLGEALALAPIDVERLFDLMARQNDDMRREAGAGATAQQRADRLQKNETELSAMLGKKYPKWQVYKQELPARLQARELVAALILADIPLSDAKADKLQAALIAAQKQNGQGAITAESNQKLLDAAAPLLTAAQLDAYKKMQEKKFPARVPAPPKQ